MEPYRASVIAQSRLRAYGVGRPGDAAMPVFGFVTNNELAAMLQTVLANQAVQSKREIKIMSGQDDLNAQLAALATNVTNQITASEAAIAKLIAANSNGDDAAFEAAAQALQTANANMKAETDKLTAALNAPPPSP